MVTRVVGFAGSLRAGSYNAALLRTAMEYVPDNGMLDIASIARIPLYNFDVEATAYPNAVAELKERIVAADGLLIATPEYNNSIPGVAKNVIDWLSRPADDAERVFKDLPVAVMGTSPGQFGTRLAQDAWLSVLRTLETMPYFEGRLAVPRAGRVFDERGTLVDESVRQQLGEFIVGFFLFAARHTRIHPAPA